MTEAMLFCEPISIMNFNLEFRYGKENFKSRGRIENKQGKLFDRNKLWNNYKFGINYKFIKSCDEIVLNVNQFRFGESKVHLEG